MDQIMLINVPSIKLTYSSYGHLTTLIVESQ